MPQRRRLKPFPSKLFRSYVGKGAYYLYAKLSDLGIRDLQPIYYDAPGWGLSIRFERSNMVVTFKAVNEFEDANSWYLVPIPEDEDDAGYIRVVITT